MSGIREIRTHHFADTTEAYDQTQTDDGIGDGDVLIIEPEGVIGVLDRAWPVAVTVAHGELHTWTAPGWEVRFGELKESTELAVKLATERGYAVNPLHIRP